jgi:hypothetical protein
MACFLVPMAVGIITTIIARKNKNLAEKLKLNWLNPMLWGGVIFLAVEHIAHREIVLYPPFLTAMQNPADVPVMLYEMATIGVGMTIAIFVVWIAMITLAANLSKLPENVVAVKE